MSLVSGPVNLKTNHPNINLIDVVSAEEMYQAAKYEFKDSDVSIMCAAVADFTPAETETTKIKEKGNITLQLVPTKDIAGELGKLKKPNQVLVGFALETNDEIKNANEKLKKKNLDFIVLNSLKDKDSGFKYDTNKITILSAGNKSLEFELKPKKQVASDILNEVEILLD